MSWCARGCVRHSRHSESGTRRTLGLMRRMMPSMTIRCSMQRSSSMMACTRRTTSSTTLSSPSTRVSIHWAISSKICSWRVSSWSLCAAALRRMRSTRAARSAACCQTASRRPGGSPAASGGTSTGAPSFAAYSRASLQAAARTSAGASSSLAASFFIDARRASSFGGAFLPLSPLASNSGGGARAKGSPRSGSTFGGRGSRPSSPAKTWRSASGPLSSSSFESLSVFFVEALDPRLVGRLPSFVPGRFDALLGRLGCLSLPDADELRLPFLDAGRLSASSSFFSTTSFAKQRAREPPPSMAQVPAGAA
mmetsp:Transcript_27791/g.94639  ORF Transcript_27791/g.94639 Transcript_27791/m.94639 type:complete len:309 (-) Transcript_27791:1073-1999(-)